MAKRNISRCSVPVKRAKDNMLYVKVLNTSEAYSRNFKMRAYDKDAVSEESLPIYLDDKLIDKDKLGAGKEVIYVVDVENVKRKVVFEIIQEKGSSGIGVSSKNRGPVNVEIRFK
ncbi:hypothetical protein N0O92_17880 [Alkalihalobacillus sp. MEB130]|uniref:hypothetical protein n=1 Tax=Alkalihalobacillus sp. MEB130 TaxID=2976704 RepID=UPI0028E01A77|nr:hypothetical protein [Alkalihalobacillus sp. MEB130]MDT8862083.1 hypothetical protein [Alkalihalobacillus sp. MEB130]